MNKQILAFFCILWLTFPFYAKADSWANEKMLISSRKKHMETALDELNNSFTFLGKKLHPKMISEFEVWMSDIGDYPAHIATDVAAAMITHRNRYSEDYHSTYYPDSKQEWIFMKENNRDFTEYTWYGKLKNGLHIVLLRQGGGSLTTLYLYAFRSYLSYGLITDEDNKIKPYYRLVLENILQHNVKYFGDVRLDRNTVKCTEDNKVLWEFDFSSFDLK